jgi:hypothetical protein
VESRSASSPPSAFDLAGSLDALRAAPSWRDYFREFLDGGAGLERPGGRREYFLRSAQIGMFAAELPGGFEFFAGRQAWLGLGRRLDLPIEEAERLVDALASGGVRIPGVSLHLRAVGWQSCVFFVVTPAARDEPLLPADWMTTLELAGDEPRRPYWIGRQRLDFERFASKDPRGGSAPWLDDLDWSRYERRGFGWKLIDSPPLPTFLSGAPET